MGCNISTGRGRFCCSQVGGIKKVFLATHGEAGNDAIISVTASSSTGEVSDINADSGQIEFFEFDLDRQLSSFNQTIVTGAGGSVAYQMDFELHMSNDSEKSWAMMQQIVESLMTVIVQDNNGVYYLCGVENGIECTGGTFAHGGDVAFTDYVGYVLNFSGTELKPAYNMSTVSPFKVWTNAQLIVDSNMYTTCQA
tara:strand:- start:942 stop:1529 length:588 start_codon:yes stop_codon:yes gene_type:complete